MDIHNRFNLNHNKITCTVTDNGSNFIKAFKQFNYSIQEPETDEEESEYTEDERTLHFSNVSNILSAADDADKYYTLPKHHRCCSHTLSLIGAKDSIAVCEQHASYKKMYQSVMSKCSVLWNKTNRSGSKATEKYHNIVGRSPKTPCPTRWNSSYDSIKELLNIESNLSEVTEVLNIPSFTFQDIEFLKEYERCIRPIAYALDKLQGDNVFLGDIFPWILAVEHNLQNIGNIKKDTNSVKYCEPLKLHLISSLKIRFHDLYNFSEHANDYIIATVSHPKWKLRWIPKDISEDRCNYIKNIVLQALKDIVSLDSLSISQSLFSQNRIQDTEIDNFFGFMEASSDDIGDNDGNIAELELLQYLGDTDSQIQNISKYKYMRQLFLKYNTPIPSSAPVERLFSFAGLILRPRRNSLSDENFEKCTLLHANNCT